MDPLIKSHLLLPDCALCHDNFNNSYSVSMIDFLMDEASMCSRLLLRRAT